METENGRVWLERRKIEDELKSIEKRDWTEMAT